MDKPALVIDQAFVESRPLSYSSLSHFRISPKHYVHYITQKREATDAMILGSLIDCLVLTPEEFEKQFFIFTKVDRRTKEGKAAFDLFESQAAGRQMVSDETYQIAVNVQNSLLDNPISRELLENRKASQIKLSWRHKETNLPMRGAIDFDTTAWGEHFLVDLKTTNNADPDAFHKKVFEMDYHIQAACYLDGYARLKFKFPNFIFLAVETSEPYGISVNFMESQEIEAAKEEFFGTLRAFRRCMDENLFHQGYEFRLSQMPYFMLRKPGYYKPMFENYKPQM